MDVLLPMWNKRNERRTRFSCLSIDKMTRKIVYMCDCMYPSHSKFFFLFPFDFMLSIQHFSYSPIHGCSKKLDATRLMVHCTRYTVYISSWLRCCYSCCTLLYGDLMTSNMIHTRILLLYDIIRCWLSIFCVSFFVRWKFFPLCVCVFLFAIRWCWSAMETFSENGK